MKQSSSGWPNISGAKKTEGADMKTKHTSSEWPNMLGAKKKIKEDPVSGYTEAEFAARCEANLSNAELKCWLIKVGFVVANRCHRPRDGATVENM